MLKTFSVTDDLSVSPSSTSLETAAPAMRAQIAALDWSSTGLGPRSEWPGSLETIVNLMLDSIEPMVIWWGVDCIQLYNDAYAPRVDRPGQPSALGQPTIVTWQHGWASIAPLVALILAGGPSTVYSDFRYEVERDGVVEDTWWTYSFTPVRDDSGAVGGVLLISEDTTQAKLSTRRQQTLDALRHELSHVREVSDLPAAVVSAIALNQGDLVAAQCKYIDTQPLSSAASASDVQITAPEVGVDADLAVVFTLSSRVAPSTALRVFLEQFTLLVASTRHRVDSEARQRIVEEERDRLLLDAPVGAAVMIGPELVYHLVNAVYANVSGRPPQEMVGKPFVDVFPELSGSPVHDKFLAVYRNGEPFVSSPTLVQIHRHGGKLDDRYFTYNLSPLRSLAGDVYGLMVIAVDITVEVESRAEVEHLNIELRAAARAKDEFLALLGHELRNPLAPIVTALDLMRMRDRSSEREQVIIRRQVHHLTRLVDDLLDVSRITRGKIELRKETFDIRDVLAGAIEMVAPMIAQRQQHIDADIASITWYGDPARLAQIVSNLLTNASRYSPAGALITLHAQRLGDAIEIAVSDTGMGVAPEQMGRIFEPFIQGERKLHDAVGGLGIGLALVKSLSELHGGFVAASSAGPGQGSTFTVRLPMASAPESLTTPTLSVQTPDVAQQYHILVVDDNMDAADTLAEILMAVGHRVSVAYTPDNALQVFRNHPVDIAILDIGLPGMTGHELAKLMRDSGLNPHVRYIALSGFGQEVDKERSANAGFEQHLIKPLHLPQLAAILAA